VLADSGGVGMTKADFPVCSIDANTLTHIAFPIEFTAKVVAISSVLRSLFVLLLSYFLGKNLVL
jgi:hypothetical protein